MFRSKTNTIEQQIFYKIADDILWLSPDWFQSYLAKINVTEKDLFDCKMIFRDGISYSPDILTILAASKKEDAYIYPRILGALIGLNYIFINPLLVYGNSGINQNNKFPRIVNKFTLELFNKLSTLNVELKEEEYTYELLKKKCIDYQAAAYNQGELLWNFYQKNTSCIQGNIIDNFYNNLINLTLYCWQLTINEQLKDRIIEIEGLQRPEYYKTLMDKFRRKKK